MSPFPTNLRGVSAADQGALGRFPCWAFVVRPNLRAASVRVDGAGREHRRGVSLSGRGSTGSHGGAGQAACPCVPLLGATWHGEEGTECICRLLVSRLQGAGFPGSNRPEPHSTIPDLGLEVAGRQSAVVGSERGSFWDTRAWRRMLGQLLGWGSGQGSPLSKWTGASWGRVVGGAEGLGGGSSLSSDPVT